MSIFSKSHTFPSVDKLTFLLSPHRHLCPSPFSVSCSMVPLHDRTIIHSICGGDKIILGSLNHFQSVKYFDSLSSVGKMCYLVFLFPKCNSFDTFETYSQVSSQDMHKNYLSSFINIIVTNLLWFCL